MEVIFHWTCVVPKNVQWQQKYSCIMDVKKTFMYKMIMTDDLIEWTPWWQFKNFRAHVYNLVRYLRLLLHLVVNCQYLKLGMKENIKTINMRCYYMNVHFNFKMNIINFAEILSLNDLLLSEICLYKSWNKMLYVDIYQGRYLVWKK